MSLAQRIEDAVRNQVSQLIATVISAVKDHVNETITINAAGVAASKIASVAKKFKKLAKKSGIQTGKKAAVTAAPATAGKKQLSPAQKAARQKSLKKARKALAKKRQEAAKAAAKTPASTKTGKKGTSGHKKRKKTTAVKRIPVEVTKGAASTNGHAKSETVASA